MKLQLRAIRTTALALLLVSAPSYATIHLSFGLYTSNKPTSMVRQFRPVLDLMEAQLTELLDEEVKIRMQVAKDYSQGIEHLASGKVDFSRFGPASYIEAKKANSGLRILAMERRGGDKVFYGIIAVAKDNSITSVSELRGKSFAFGNDQSTIGRYLSQQYLRNNGIYSSDLSRYDYLGRHDMVGTAVGAHHFEAGALNESTFNKLVAKGVEIRELARFPNVTKPWIAREGLPPSVFDALRQALLNLSDPVLQKTLKVDGFVAGNDADYEDIRTAIEKNNLFFEGSGPVAATSEQDTGSTVQNSESDKEPTRPEKATQPAPETATIEPEKMAPEKQPSATSTPAESASTQPPAEHDKVLQPSTPDTKDTRDSQADLGTDNATQYVRSDSRSTVARLPIHDSRQSPNI